MYTSQEQMESSNYVSMLMNFANETEDMLRHTKEVIEEIQAARQIKGGQALVLEGREQAYEELRQYVDSQLLNGYSEQNPEIPSEPETGEAHTGP